MHNQIKGSEKSFKEFAIGFILKWVKKFLYGMDIFHQLSQK